MTAPAAPEIEALAREWLETVAYRTSPHIVKSLTALLVKVAGEARTGAMREVVELADARNKALGQRPYTHTDNTRWRAMGINSVCSALQSHVAARLALAGTPDNERKDRP